MGLTLRPAQVDIADIHRSIVRRSKRGQDRRQRLPGTTEEVGSPPPDRERVQQLSKTLATYGHVRVLEPRIVQLRVQEWRRHLVHTVGLLIPTMSSARSE